MRSLLIAALIVLAGQAPEKTREEELLTVQAVLQGRLAQTAAALAQCESNGPQSAQWQKQAQDTLLLLQRLLAARGLELKPDGTIGDAPKPKDR